MKSNNKWILLLIPLSIFISGCATTKTFSSVDNLNENVSSQISKIAVMPLDVTLSILPAGGFGLLEPQAEWSKIALTNIEGALYEIDKKRVSDFIDYKKPEESNQVYKTIVEHEKLHRAVGHAILFNLINYNTHYQRKKYFRLDTRKWDITN